MFLPFAGLLSTTVSNPLWVVKTRMQLSEQAVSMCYDCDVTELCFSRALLRHLLAYATLYVLYVSNMFWRFWRRMRMLKDIVDSNYIGSLSLPADNGQLAHQHRMVQSIRDVFRESGIRGFYKGLTASYAGISETVIQFVVYERLKQMAEIRLIESASTAGNPSPREGIS